MPVTLVGAQVRFVLAQGQADIFTAVREVDVVQGVERILQLIETFVETEVRQILIANAHFGIAPGLADPEAYFAAVADLAPQVQAEAVTFQAVFGNRVVVQRGLDVLRTEVQVRRDEVA
ncbi:hypothetical protein D3C72_1912010 [compost metagenome]